MEVKSELQNSGVMKGDEVPDTYRVAARTENMTQFGGSEVAPPLAPPLAVAAPSETPITSTEVKKKRGRPRKYGLDGSLALSPMPISASTPLMNKKKHKFDFGGPSGEGVACSVGSSFTPHIITVNAGEDVSMKILSFSQQGSRAVFIIAANGAISNVTLCQPTACGGTLTYEGRFEMLSLSGSYMPGDTGGTKSRTGGMSVLLAGPDGRVMGGGLAGLLVAAGPVQVVIGSFLPGHQQQEQRKKQKVELSLPFSPVPVANHIFGGADAVCTGTNQSITPASCHGDNVGSGNTVHDSSITHASNHENNMASGITVQGRSITSAPYQGDNTGSENATHGQGITLAPCHGENEGSGNGTPERSTTHASYHGNTSDSGNGQTIVGAENNKSLPTKSEAPSPSNCMVSC